MTDLTRTDLTRRDALKLLGVAALAGALDCTPTETDRAARQAQQARRTQARTAKPFAPTFFTPHEYATVAVLVDLVIPSDERSGSATDVGVPEFMDFIMHDAPELKQTAMRGGLAWMDRESHRRTGRTFLESTPAERTALLDDIAWPKRARPELHHGVAFFNSFRDLTASGFWSTEAGWRDLQYKGDVFNPNWNGCPPAALEKLGVSYGGAGIGVPGEERGARSEGPGRQDSGAAPNPPEP